MVLIHFVRRFPKVFSRHERNGVAAIEFALYATIFLVVLAGTVDIGNLIFAEFQLDNAVEAGAEYALVNNAAATSSGGVTLANSISSIVNNGHGSGGGWSNTVVVNNGPTTTTSNGSPTASGTAGSAASCYCPTGSPGSWTWGAAKTCNSSCTAGVFVSIVATRNIAPFFPAWGFVTNSTTLTRSAMVQVATSAN